MKSAAELKFVLPRYRLLQVFAVLAALYTWFYLFMYRPYSKSRSIYYTSPIRNERKISVGYTLIAPYNNLLNQNKNNKGYVYLLDLFGRPVHMWTTERQVLSARLAPSGRLFVVMEAPKYSQIYPGGGNTGTIEELDWNSDVVWQYTNDSMHHDFILKDNGNVVLILWEKTPLAIGKTVKGGIPNSELHGTVWSDAIVELNPKGDIVWSWHSYEHLNPAVDVIDPALTRAGWTYINGISYVAHNPIDGEEGYIVSMRSLDTVMILRKRDGRVIWRSPKGMLNTQHDPNILPNGNVLVFDNGFTRLPYPETIYGSRVVEINPKSNQIVWSFDGGTGVMEKLEFFGPLVGGAQPLPNGNILITDGPRGHIFEVTPGKEIVWDLVSPYRTKTNGYFPVNFLFKARRYTAEAVHFPKTLPPPVDWPIYFISKTLAPLYMDNL